MKLKFSKKLPNREGYYWFVDFSEHTPVILWVDKLDNGFYASNEEFNFKVKKGKFDKDEDCKIDGYYSGEVLWCYIPCPTLPNGKKTKPNCY